MGQDKSKNLQCNLWLISKVWKIARKIMMFSIGLTRRKMSDPTHNASVSQEAKVKKKAEETDEKK